MAVNGMERQFRELRESKSSGFKGRRHAGVSSGQAESVGFRIGAGKCVSVTPVTPEPPVAWIVFQPHS